MTLFNHLYFSIIDSLYFPPISRQGRRRVQLAVIERVVERRQHDGRRQEVRRNSPGGTIGWETVSNKILLFCHHFSNRRLTLWFESSLRRGGRYRPKELEGKRYRPAISAAMSTAGASCGNSKCGGRVSAVVINRGGGGDQR